MMKRIETGIDDLVRELSPESKGYYEAMQLGEGWDETADPLIFKYVRLGRQIFVGSHIQYGRYGFKIYHREIANRGYELMSDDERIAARAQAEEGTTMTYNERKLAQHDNGSFGLMIDAGSGRFISDKDMIMLGGRSADFHQPSSDEFEETLTLASTAMSDQFEIVRF